MHHLGEFMHGWGATRLVELVSCQLTCLNWGDDQACSQREQQRRADSWKNWNGGWMMLAGNPLFKSGQGNICKCVWAFRKIQHVPRFYRHILINRRVNPCLENMSGQNQNMAPEESLVISISSGWWFGTFFIFHILGIVIPTDWYFSEGLKPPTSHCSPVMTLP